MPEHLHNERAVGVIGVFAGTEAELRDVLAPIYALEPQGGLTAEMPYAEIQCAIDDPPGFRNYWSASHLASLPDEALDLYCRQGEDMIVPSPSQHLLIPWGGARRRPGHGLADDASRRHVGDPSVRALGRRGRRRARQGLGPAFRRGDEAVRHRLGLPQLRRRTRVTTRCAPAYGEENYARLAAVKAEFDPDNVFNRHHPIKPLAPA